MKLRRIEAVRFGSLVDRTLGELGDGLTIVHGPNEAGKTSFLTLVRAVLYGFPTASKEDAYLSAAGKREGRLVFSDDSGSWVLERTEGPHGGPCSVRTLEGSDRPRLRDEVTAGVSEDAFRVVLGFGLDDMARIEMLRDSGVDIIEPLYAASVGMRVSPQAVRESLAAHAETIFAPRGRSKRVQELHKALESVRAELHKLRAAGAHFASERQRLEDLEVEREKARALRDQRRTHHAALVAALQEYDALLAQVNSQEVALLDMRRERASTVAARENTPVDARALSVAHEVDALVGEASAFVQNLERMREMRAAVAQTERRFAEACEALGWSADHVLAVDMGPAIAAFVDEARTELAGLEADRASREREAERASAEAARLSAVATKALETVGLGPDADETDLDFLTAELDSAQEQRVLHGEYVRRSSGPAWVLLAAGLLTAVAGVTLREYISAVVGAALVMAGAVFLLRSRGVSTRTVTGAPDSDTYRARRALDAARVALENARQAEAVAARATEEARLAADTVATRSAIFARRLEASGLPGDMTPLEASRVLAAVSEARSISGEAARKRDEVELLAERLAAFVARTQDVAGRLWGRTTELTLDEVTAEVGRMKEAVAAARSAHAERDKLDARIAELDARIGVAETEAKAAASKGRELLARFDLAFGGSRAELDVLEQQAETDLEAAEEQFERLTYEASALKGALGTLADEDRAAQLRLDEAGLLEQISEAVEEYATHAVAARLLALAQERYERERQPDVVRRAEQIFRRITADRYVALAIPLGEGRIEVFDARSAAKPSARLSKGTAEALYLALRLGLVWHLGDVGTGLPMLIDDVLANFDPERLEGAARAIVDLSGQRQVVFFTCHDETAELFGTLAPDAVRIDLERC
ncbi:MAG: AAA family ATPase [Coriobacteriales bacterium]